MEKFERINFFGEDAEDVLTAGRPHTPVGGGGTFPTHAPSVTATGLSLTATTWTSISTVCMLLFSERYHVLFNKPMGECVTDVLTTL